MKKAPDSFHTPSWLAEVVGEANGVRLQQVDKILADLARKNSEAGRMVKSFKDRREFIKPSFVPYFYFIPMNRTLENRLIHLKFKHPMVGLKHKRLPLIMISGCPGGASENVVPMGYVETFGTQKGAPKHYLNYAHALSKMSAAEKKKLLELSLDGMRSYQKENKNKSRGWFSDYLANNKDFTLKGYALNFSYINLDPEYGETGPIWVHPWGLPSLLYQHKRNPIYMLTGPAHRLDENILGQRNMTGHTG
jgi:hypothetical protein